MTTQSKLKYSVVILRKDGEHIIIESGENYKKCKILHKKLDSQWEVCHKESTPFRMELPEVTSFEPGLIFEIKIVAGPLLPMAEMEHNPYVQRMNQQGLAGSFPGQGNALDSMPQNGMFDQGYKR